MTVNAPRRALPMLALGLLALAAFDVLATSLARTSHEPESAATPPAASVDAPAQLLVASVAPPPIRGVELLPMPSVVRGRVLLGDLEIPGARIDARQVGGDSRSGLKAWAPIVTDARGRFEACFDADATVALRAVSGLAESDWVEVQTGDGSVDDVVLQLADPYVLRGQVLQTDGGPVEFVLVDAVADSPEDRRHDLDLFGMSTSIDVTDADGRFAIGVKHPGTFHLRAQAGGDLAATSDALILSDAAPELTVTLQLAHWPPSESAPRQR